MELLSVLESEIQYTLASILANSFGLIVLLRITRSEQAIENRAWIHLLCKWACRVTPREIGAVGTTVARIAAPRLRAAFESQFQRGEPCLIANFPRNDLIDRSSVENVGTVGLLWVSARQKRGGAASVIPTSVAVRASTIQREIGQHVELGFQMRNRF